MSDVGGTGGPVADENRVHIFDTTLRDGEQSPGISLNTQEKVEIAQQLARLGVDVIEAGFPITSPGDFEAVEAIARARRGLILARTRLDAGPVENGLERRPPPARIAHGAVPQLSACDARIEESAAVARTLVDRHDVNGRHLLDVGQR